MLNVSTSSTSTDAAGNVRRGTRKALRDAADRGFEVSQEHVSHGADSFLANSGYPPEELADGTWEWGYSAGYAAAVEDGSEPHWIPVHAMDGLERWSRRILGDEGAAWAVRHKIAKEGTEANPFVEPGKEAQEAYLQARGISASVEREF
ncbi:hypothetical protein HALLA_12110 [Halostagnicola larsenii XH-48]|uniref:Uncharacterized protein n=1 Tax=Halostagnicola larsenii XH-48 TaxID=797299 RepID=W0JUK0_9EURY|nr:hypothetical protein [Halostagnicola larsenii]AHG00920.1 hypothetical protein HALLA_11810 [Halostagnicola larsenii XH-48]AHG00969.1 hypothetical protein HALLA_12110 [Halostagnicola larsenii XH-48]